MFTLQAGEKKFLAIATVVALVFVAVVAVGVTLLTVSDDDDEVPYLQASTGETLVHVEPTILCSIDLSDCRQSARGTYAKRLPVPAGQSVVVSVSADIATAPWSLTLEYLTPQGFVQDRPDPFRPGSKYAFTASSTTDRLLANVEVRLPSGRVDAGGNEITRGFWSINTLVTPAGGPQR